MLIRLGTEDLFLHIDIVKDPLRPSVMIFSTDGHYELIGLIQPPDATGEQRPLIQTIFLAGDPFLNYLEW